MKNLPSKSIDSVLIDQMWEMRTYWKQGRLSNEEFDRKIKEIAENYANKQRVGKNKKTKTGKY